VYECPVLGKFGKAKKLGLSEVHTTGKYTAPKDPFVFSYRMKWRVILCNMNCRARNVYHNKTNTDGGFTASVATKCCIIKSLEQSPFLGRVMASK
jgi:hypothetical protein